ncbi:uncharacterized protein LOC121390402 [Gigantopelta aegis]|uniref:uncharacterized protein LOC121390402 n=1 Tax=Gigantopelta aegis TaxID=1735272 RepID=UPI001B88E133|nr:uncharacterized protein LOC121390402 [Gigantopelta aegis]
MKSMECLVVLSLVAGLFVSLSFSAPTSQVSSHQKENAHRFRRDLGMSSWNVIRPWESRTPCSHRMCWSDDDCCRGFVCVGISDWRDMAMPGTCAKHESEFAKILENSIDWA